MLTPNACNGIVICSEQNENEKNRRLYFPVLYMGNAAFLFVFSFSNPKMQSLLDIFCKVYYTKNAKQA